MKEVFPMIYLGGYNKENKRELLGLIDETRIVNRHDNCPGRWAIPGNHFLQTS